MFRKLSSLLICAILALTLCACGTQKTADAESTPAVETAPATETSSDEMIEAAADNALAEDTDALMQYAERFTQETYTDTETGLSVTCNLFLPASYDETAAYPMVVFIADSSCANGNAEASLTQGRGALVWASDAWQAAHECVVLVPTYPTTILDDHGSYTTTEYVELTKRLIDDFSARYAVDTDRIYGTGQSMGCMTTLILSSEYPELYAGCMFVDGQWDVSTLKGLEEQTFVYFAAEDDTNAWNGAQEVMAMMDSDAVAYAYAQWDGSWAPDELSAAASALFASDVNRYFVSWASGTIEAKSGGMGGMGGAAYHMASFDYAYRCVAVMEWLFAQ